MTTARTALLTDRGVVRVTGPDAAKLLQGLVTNDMGLLATQPAIHAGLLSPQGKILFDFFVVKAPGGFCLETARDKAASLAERLMMYRLRADADIKDKSSDYTVAAIWGGAREPHGEGPPPLWFADPRLPAMGCRELVTMGSDWALGAEDASSATQDDYHAHRIAQGVPEGGRDYAFGDTFPHEALFDLLDGVSFTKGCYVGQEVVSRMQNRGTARKRVVPVVGDASLPIAGSTILAGDAEIGRLGSVASDRGLALLRLDRAAELAANGEGLRAGSVKIRIVLPDWAHALAPQAASHAP
jgi:folate-binding protein YgfZ